MGSISFHQLEYFASCVPSKKGCPFREAGSFFLCGCFVSASQFVPMLDRFLSQPQTFSLGCPLVFPCERFCDYSHWHTFCRCHLYNKRNSMGTGDVFYTVLWLNTRRVKSALHS